MLWLNNIKVHTGYTTSDVEVKDRCLLAWELLFMFKHELGSGCRDDDPADRQRHSEKLRMTFERFVDVFRQLAGTKAVTPYMHVVLAHVPDMVLRHGSLSKFSSQGVEAVHQPIKRDALGGNRKDTAKGVLAKQALRGKAAQTKTSLKKEKELLPGGHAKKSDVVLHMNQLRRCEQKHA